MMVFLAEYPCLKVPCTEAASNCPHPARAGPGPSHRFNKLWHKYESGYVPLKPLLNKLR